MADETDMKEEVAEVSFFIFHLVSNTYCKGFKIFGHLIFLLFRAILFYFYFSVASDWVFSNLSLSNIKVLACFTVCHGCFYNTTLQCIDLMA